MMAKQAQVDTMFALMRATSMAERAEEKTVEERAEEAAPDEVPAEVTEPDDRNEMLKREMEAYLREPPVPLRDGQGKFNNPLAWWKLNSTRFPHLARLAKKYLALPATSAAAERLFSKCGLVLSKLRNRLAPESLELLVLAAVNRDLL